MTSSTVMNVAAIPRVLTGTRLDPRSSTWFSLIVICAVLAVGVAGAVASFAGQMAFARWALLEGPVAFTVPIVIDGSIVVFTLAAILQRSRGDSTLISWTFVGLFTGVSVAANALHVLSQSPEVDPVRVLGGAFIAGLMPISIWLVTHVLTGLLVQKPELSPEELQALESQKRRRDEEEQLRRSAVADEMRRQATEQRELEEQEASRWAEWERVKDSPEASQRGTAERAFVVRTIRDFYSGAANRNAQFTADRLGVSYSRVRSAIDEGTQNTDNWNAQE